MTHPDTFGARSTLTVGDTTHEIYRLEALQSTHDVARLPYTLRILLENVLRREDGDTVSAADVEASGWAGLLFSRERGRGRQQKGRWLVERRGWREQPHPHALPSSSSRSMPMISGPPAGLAITRAPLPVVKSSSARPL